MGRFALTCLSALLVLSMATGVSAATIDTDADGLDDTLEVLFKTDPLNADTDGDGFSDGAEVFAGYSPLDIRTKKLTKEIVISISKQQMEMRLGGVTLATYPVSTGLPSMPTPIGSFSIKNKIKRAWSSSAKLWMPWWMQFTALKGGTVGIHELPEWPNGRKEGASSLGKPASHGCVRLGIGVAKKIYDWAPIGTKVTVVR